MDSSATTSLTPGFSASEEPSRVMDSEVFDYRHKFSWWHEHLLRTFEYNHPMEGGLEDTINRLANLVPVKYRNSAADGESFEKAWTAALKLAPEWHKAVHAQHEPHREVSVVSKRQSLVHRIWQRSHIPFRPEPKSSGALREAILSHMKTIQKSWQRSYDDLRGASNMASRNDGDSAATSQEQASGPTFTGGEDTTAADVRDEDDMSSPRWSMCSDSDAPLCEPARETP